MFNVRLAGGHLYGKRLFTWLSLVMSLMASFCAVLFPNRCLGWDLGLNSASFWGISYLLLLKPYLFFFKDIQVNTLAINKEDLNSSSKLAVSTSSEILKFKVQHCRLYLVQTTKTWHKFIFTFKFHNLVKFPHF